MSTAFSPSTNVAGVRFTQKRTLVGQRTARPTQGGCTSPFNPQPSCARPTEWILIFSQRGHPAVSAHHVGCRAPSLQSRQPPPPRIPIHNPRVRPRLPHPLRVLPRPQPLLPVHAPARLDPHHDRQRRHDPRLPPLRARLRARPARRRRRRRRAAPHPRRRRRQSVFPGVPRRRHVRGRDVLPRPNRCADGLGAPRRVSVHYGDRDPLGVGAHLLFCGVSGAPNPPPRPLHPPPPLPLQHPLRPRLPPHAHPPPPRPPPLLRRRPRHARPRRDIGARVPAACDVVCGVCAGVCEEVQEGKGCEGCCEQDPEASPGAGYLPRRAVPCAPLLRLFPYELHRDATAPLDRRRHTASPSSARARRRVGVVLAVLLPFPRKRQRPPWLAPPLQLPAGPRMGPPPPLARPPPLAAASHTKGGPPARDGAPDERKSRQGIGVAVEGGGVGLCVGGEWEARGSCCAFSP